jgi:mono/diheme cytochrome c family protein
MKFRNQIYIILIFASFFFIFTQINCKTEPEKKEMSNEEMIRRGEYLVTFGGCHDCHSPKIFGPQGPVDDTTRMLSGHPQDFELPEINVNEIQPGKWYLANAHLTAWVGPWGVSFAKNLTPDEPTGIGNWTEEIFIKSMREGKEMGFGRNILPPMPWFNVAKLSDEDLKSVFLYLKSIKPIRNEVPQPIPPDSINKAE